LLLLVFRKKNAGVDFKAPARPTRCEAMYKWALYLFFYSANRRITIKQWLSFSLDLSAERRGA